MKARKRSSSLPFRPYPEYQGIESGCKVGWYFYLDRADAVKASEAARWNGRLREGLGFDFGYQSPGAIEPDRWPSPVKGRTGYWVTIP